MHAVGFCGESTVACHEASWQNLHVKLIYVWRSESFFAAEARAKSLQTSRICPVLQRASYLKGARFSTKTFYIGNISWWNCPPDSEIVTLCQPLTTLGERLTRTCHVVIAVPVRKYDQPSLQNLLEKCQQGICVALMYFARDRFHSCHIGLFIFIIIKSWIKGSPNEKLTARIGHPACSPSSTSVQKKRLKSQPWKTSKVHCATQRTRKPSSWRIWSWPLWESTQLGTKEGLHLRWPAGLSLPGVNVMWKQGLSQQSSETTQQKQRSFSHNTSKHKQHMQEDRGKPRPEESSTIEKCRELTLYLSTVCNTTQDLNELDASGRCYIC